ncbi:CRISPR-associated endonuclease Cas2 [Gulosibacter hominis]|uniref:CRISPR-associated endonuclease Cas2 n=1 Tax=Gulosibacter hominis TaxID=2770504 RepID=UPI001919BF35|nr:CRISPR-associated endonuclease Cas2 [Gulosibacter hominis]
MADPVWLLLMFDLPVKEPEQRRVASKYRKLLLDEGFSMIQLSVYVRHLINGTAAIPVIEFLKNNVPAQGHVRILRLTDDQWARGWRLYGSEYIEPEAPPDALVLFDF